uniref:(California timema) hypothetical protein n=1 Tax=Timema californicum TaxID=61474 RepID=A0A7R9JF64_TIMCA|nr:unnamed protein product [Timema californicum]
MFAVVSELAHFHALSLSMKRIDPTRFKRDVSDSITEAMFVIENEAWYRDYYKTASRNAIAMRRYSRSGSRITEIPASHENIVEEGSRNFKARYVRKEYSEEELPKIH